jgi:hypothetical protein
MPAKTPPEVRKAILEEQTERENKAKQKAIVFWEKVRWGTLIIYLVAVLVCIGLLAILFIAR